MQYACLVCEFHALRLSKVGFGNCTHAASVQLVVLTNEVCACCWWQIANGAGSGIFAASSAYCSLLLAKQSRTRIASLSYVAVLPKRGLSTCGGAQGNFGMSICNHCWMGSLRQQ